MTKPQKPRSKQTLAGVARRRARARGAKTYHGRPCPRCGETWRATCNSVCIRCNRSAYSRLTAKEKRRRQVVDRDLARRQRLAYEALLLLGVNS
jgi:hypothetical protein